MEDNTNENNQKNGANLNNNQNNNKNKTSLTYIFIIIAILLLPVIILFSIVLIAIGVIVVNSANSTIEDAEKYNNTAYYELNDTTKKNSTNKNSTNETNNLKANTASNSTKSSDEDLFSSNTTNNNNTNSLNAAISTKLSDNEKELFNAIFEGFEGNVKGSVVKVLISSVISNNAIGDRIVSVTYDGYNKIDNNTDLDKIKANISNSKQYDVILNYDANGIINNVEIKQK